MKISNLIGVLAAVVVAGGAFYWVMQGEPHTSLSAALSAPQTAATTTGASFAYTCANGAELMVTPSADLSNVVVSDNSGASSGSLTLARGADGASWSGQGLTLTGSGNTITLSGAAGQQTTCTTTQTAGQ